MISLIHQRFYYPDYSYSGTPYTTYLFGSIGDKVRAETTVEVHWETLEASLVFTTTGNTIERTDGGSFTADGFQAGDNIEVDNTAANDGNYKIDTISDDGTILYLDNTFGIVVNETDTSADIYGTTPVTAVDFFPNICENDVTTFFDLTDRNTSPRFYVTGVTVPGGTKNMSVGSNSIGWQTGVDGTTNGCTFDGISNTNRRQRITIKHTFLITPVYVAGELTNLQNGTPPAATNLRDRRALKYICQVDAKFTNYDPNIPHSGQFTDNRGMTGWFDEFVNGNQTDYWFESIRMTLGAEEIETLEYCDPVNVEIKLMSHGKFTSGTERKVILNMMWLPQDESFYVDKRTDWKKNFIFERATPLMSVGGTVQGENASGDYHFLKNVTATRISDNECRVNFTVEYSDTIIEFFDARDENDRNYLMWVTTEQGLLASPLNGDRTAILCEVDLATCDKDDPTLFQIIDNVFYEYPECSGIGYSEVKGYARDTWLNVCQFWFKKGATAKTLSVVVDIVDAAYTGAGQQQQQDQRTILEQYTIDLTAFPKNCEDIQEIDLVDLNNYRARPTRDCNDLDRVRVRRMPYLDIHGYAAYEIQYPFKIRWEEWITVFPASICYPNPTQNWEGYIGAGQQQQQQIRHVIEAAVEQDGHTTEFQHISNITIKQPCDDAIAKEIKTYLADGTTEIDDLIAQDQNTIIEVTFKGEFANYPASELYAIGFVDKPDTGGVNYIWEISTEQDNATDSWLQGTSSGVRATLTKIDDSTVKVAWQLVYNYAPEDAEQYVISARLGYKPASQSSSGECPVRINFINFECSNLEIIEVESTEILVVSGIARTNEEREVPIQSMRLQRVTNQSWTILSGGLIDGDAILSGTMTTNSNNYPIYPYTDTLVDEQIAGHIEGTANSSDISINGIGEMQIGCSFFVS